MQGWSLSPVCIRTGTKGASAVVFQQQNASHAGEKTLP